MSKAQYIRPSGPSHNSEAVRLGSAADAGGRLASTEQFKFVKFAGTDRYDLCAAGDIIEAVITSIEPATSAGWTVGGINKFDKMYVTADGLQATPGTGVIAAGDYVVCGTVVAKGTALGSTTYAKVCKATIQPGTAPADLAAAGTQISMLKGLWRVVSLLEAGTGAVGTTLVVERSSIPGVAA